MARFIVCLPAGPHTRYAPDAFAGQIGKPITVNHPDGRPATGTLVDAQVGSGGTEALLTIEWEDPLDVPRVAADDVLSPRPPDAAFSSRRPTLMYCSSADAPA